MLNDRDQKIIGRYGLKPSRQLRIRPWRRGWFWWTIAIIMTPTAIVMAAYEPAFVPITRNVNTTAPVTGGGALSSDLTISVPAATATTSGLVPTPPNNTTTFLRGDATFATPPSAVVPTIATATGTSPITITATNLLTTIVSMATPTASTINLPTAVQTAGFRECIKDGTTNFATNNATVKSPTSGTIDGTAGSTGVTMSQTHQELCFITDGTNWFIE